MSADHEQRLTEAREDIENLRAAMQSVIIGQDAVLDQVLWALLAGGHVLLEGAPGLGKTLLVKTLASCLHLTFSRVQFTPDLMPGDITGSNVLLLDDNGTSTGRFELYRGPVFTQLLLADEINRASPKTQSALLEAMAERAVTISGSRHELSAPFMVFATENPIEMEGTFPLPEAQLDRFLLKILVPAPGAAELEEILERTTAHPVAPPKPVLTEERTVQLQSLCRDIVIPRPVLAYASRLATATAPEATPLDAVRRAVRFGASVRGAQALVLAAKAHALIDGRANVSFEDVRSVAKPALRHRLVLSFEGEADGTTADELIDKLCNEPLEAKEGTDAEL
jgi:MoxR-like ATPase